MTTETLSQMAQRHFDAEEMLRAGTFGFDEPDMGWSGHGSSVGCFALEAGYNGVGDIHEFVARKFNYPIWAVLLQDRIFEGLALSDNHREWHVNFARAVEGVTDWKSALHRIHCAILDVALESAGDAAPQVRAVRDLHASQCDDDAAWDAAESAARSAARSAERSAARTAAMIAAGSAAESAAERSAAWSAAVSAARGAAASAARTAARSAAMIAGGSAAESAAWSAERSAAMSAAESAAYKGMAASILAAMREPEGAQ